MKTSPPISSSSSSSKETIAQRGARKAVKRATICQGNLYEIIRKCLRECSTQSAGIRILRRRMKWLEDNGGKGWEWRALKNTMDWLEGGAYP